MPDDLRPAFERHGLGDLLARHRPSAAARTPPPRATPGLPAVARLFRPATEWNRGEEHPVEVVHVEQVGPDALAVCRGLDDPAWCYEIATPLRVAIGSLGTICCTGLTKKFAPRWHFALAPSATPQE